MVLINPGTGPVGGRPLLAHAWRNVRQLRRDIAKRVSDAEIVRRPDRDDGEGRYGFELHASRRRCRVQMPGVPLEAVRDLEGKPPRIPPRLYVNGDSWFWYFAVGWVVRALGGDGPWGGGPCP